VTVKANYNLWFWILRTIFGLGFLYGVLLIVKDFFKLGRESYVEAETQAEKATA
jgi:hypothetical protein